MHTVTDKFASPAAFEPWNAEIEPIPLHQAPLDGSWWPDSDGLGARLSALIPVLDHVRGPVTWLMLNTGAWTNRPHEIVVDDRTIAVRYRSGVPESMMKVYCADGGSFTIRMAPAGPAPEAAWDGEFWQSAVTRP